MIPDYREPHPWPMKNKQAINMAALGLGAVMFVGFPSGPSWLKAAFAVGIILDFMVWSYFHTCTTPGSEDYHDYLAARANQDNNVAWLDSVNTDFKELWEMDPAKPVKEVLPR